MLIISSIFDDNRFFSSLYSEQVLNEVIIVEMLNANEIVDIIKKKFIFPFIP
jgi:hypothetical protein